MSKVENNVDVYENNAESTAIKKHIEKFWMKPIGLDTNSLESSYIISLNSEGIVSGLKLLKSSGSDGFDASVSRAIRRASPLPMPENPEKFLKLILNFQG
ncbi:MAG: hypothetical protein COY40_02105 [Alphaproteobacteria bacterium CG_4_10_14_0_8_um_filter_53_9]|nr:MAG: hypothetical protein COY40_02105 [Alphaproteobacteria bacterium CG_4_10_14_0_8_um_filter_53_9]